MVRTYTLFHRLAEPDRHSDGLARRNINGLRDSRVTRAAHNEHLRPAQQTDQAEAAVIPRYRRDARHWNLARRIKCSLPHSRASSAALDVSLRSNPDLPFP